MRNFNTLSEYNLHKKHCQEYQAMEDEIKEVKCFECDGTFLECDTVNWQFSHTARSHVYCMLCFTNNRDQENDATETE